MKSVTEQQHIDYLFSGLNDGDEAGDDDDDSNYDDDDNDDGELSFDYGQNDLEHDVSTPRKSMEVTLTFFGFWLRNNKQISVPFKMNFIVQTK